MLIAASQEGVNFLAKRSGFHSCAEVDVAGVEVVDLDVLLEEGVMFSILSLMKSAG